MVLTARKAHQDPRITTPFRIRDEKAGRGRFGSSSRQTRNPRLHRTIRHRPCGLWLSLWSHGPAPLQLLIVGKKSSSIGVEEDAWTSPDQESDLPGRAKGVIAGQSARRSRGVLVKANQPSSSVAFSRNLSLLKHWSSVPLFWCNERSESVQIVGMINVRTMNMSLL
jgi:hypothetical protein